jgi:hypothetical protein
VLRWDCEGYDFKTHDIVVPTDAPAFVYLRITQSDGGLAWTSPI